MAGWLLRAITMENVEARRRGAVLELPAAPTFRLEREIKNVVTVIAKTSHYWLGHMPAPQRHAVAALLATMTKEAPLLTPDASPERARTNAALAAAAGALIEARTGLRISPEVHSGWLGIECADVRVAVWLMRALVARNVLSRREGTVLYVPLNAGADPEGARLADAVAGVFFCARARGVV
jgi:hypothetical protein